MQTKTRGLYWNYFGIDEDPPAGRLMLLTEHGVETGTKHHVDAIAWAVPQRHPIKEECQRILHGFPELKMVACICKDEALLPELATALLHYEPIQDIAALVDLIRVLDRRAHAGPNCIANNHGGIS